MNNETKTQIQAAVKEYVSQFESQSKAVALLTVSEATIINILKGKWESIADDMWRKVGKQVGYNPTYTWYLEETQDMDSLIMLFSDAKDYSNVYGITGPSGSGKSAVAEWYAKNKPNTYHLTCAEYYNKRMFLSKLLHLMGKENTGLNVADMMDLIVDILMKQEAPLIILDEADKLNDQVLYFFITLYNMLKGRCGIVLMATDFLSKRIMRGVKMNKKGYNEIFSRIGRRFIPLNGVNKEEVIKICKRNGVTEEYEINRIWNECNQDLRRVERGVHKVRRQKDTSKAA